MSAAAAMLADQEAALQTSTEHWQLAQLALEVFAVAPAALGGIRVIAWSSAARETWLRDLGEQLPAATPLISMHPNVDDGQLLGGLDMAQTMASGRITMATGLLARADTGVLLVRMAERLSDAQLAALGSALDEQQVRVERDGLSAIASAHFGCVVLDEGIPGEEAVASGLLDRLGLAIDLHPVMRNALAQHREQRGQREQRIAGARARLDRIATPATLLPALCQTAWKLNIVSLRAPLLALRTARIVAALAGASSVLPEHAETAVQLVYGPRAIAVPPPAEQSESQDPAPADEASGGSQEQPDTEQDEQRANVDDLTEMLLQSTRAALPQQLLAQAAFARSRGDVVGAGGRFGPMRIATERGVPLDSRPGRPGGRARLDLIATLRRAVPWQRLRRDPKAADSRPLLRTEDFAVRRFKQHAPTVTIFVVDASGSAAMQRLAEAKGAAEQLLAECYVRRDEVALIVFRGRTAEMLLSPTRSLVRAKRALTQLAGGGGTPLATGLQRALVECQRIRRRGAVPLLVIMSDGRPNVTLAGTGDRKTAEAEARLAARAIGHQGEAAIFVDTSVRGQPLAREFADLMHGGYLPLPHVDHRALTEHLRSVSGAAVTHQGR